MIRVDKGSEFQSRVMDSCTYRHSLHPDLIPPREPTNNGHSEPFPGRLRHEFLTTHIVFVLVEARSPLTAWQKEDQEVTGTVRWRTAHPPSLLLRGTERLFALETVPSKT